MTTVSNARTDASHSEPRLRLEDREKRELMNPLQQTACALHAKKGTRDKLTATNCKSLQSFLSLFRCCCSG